jgi:hypothetical protein
LWEALATRDPNESWSIPFLLSLVALHGGVLHGDDALDDVLGDDYTLQIDALDDGYALQVDVLDDDNVLLHDDLHCFDALLHYYDDLLHYDALLCDGALADCYHRYHDDHYCYHNAGPYSSR